jgi:hypothetical protein
MIQLTAKVEERELRKYIARLDRNRGRPLLQRAERTTTAAAQRVLVPRLKATAPVGRGKYLAGGNARGGNLRRRIRAKRLRQRPGEDIHPTWVGSSAFYHHIVVRGSRSHSLATREAGRTVTFMGRRGMRSFTANLRKSPYLAFGTDQVRHSAGVMHPGSRANPFVGRAIDPNLDIVYSLIRKDVFDVR